MAITISDTTPRVQYTATSGQTSFTVNFEFFVNADLKVYNASSLLTYAAAPANATQYSVTGAGITGGGSITLGSPGATLNDVITIYRDMSVSRSTDFPTSGTFQVDSLNEELDKLTAMVQQVETDTKYSPKFSQTTATGFNLTFPELVASKILQANSAATGLEFVSEIGSFKGNWATATAYSQRDIIKDTSNANIYIANASHTSSGAQPISSNTDVGKWDLLVDAASATTSASAAATSATASATSATSAATSATASATSATSSATQATNAASSATAAASSATAAASSAAAALGDLDTFQDQYLGVKSADPSVDNDGDALTSGDIYFNNSTSILRIYDGSTWVSAAVDTSTMASAGFAIAMSVAL